MFVSRKATCVIFICAWRDLLVVCFAFKLLAFLFLGRNLNNMSFLCLWLRICMFSEAYFFFFPVAVFWSVFASAELQKGL